MSRTGLHRPRRNRAVWDRPATGTRLFPNPHSPTVSKLNPHYMRCPKAERLRLRSDQSSFRPVPVTGYGRFPDKNWLALSKGPCQVRAPLTRRIILAPSGDAHEHGVMLLNRAIVPRDSAVVALGEAYATQRRHQSPRPHISEWPGTSGGRDCPTPRFPRVSSTSSQKLGAVAEPAPMWNIRCGGPHASVQASPSSCATVRDLPSPPPPVFSVIPAEAENPSPEGQGPRSSGRTLPFSSRDDRPVAQGVGAPSGASTPLPTHERNRNLPCPSLLHRRLPHPRKMAKTFPGEQSYRHELSIESIKSPHRDNPLTQ